MTRFPERREYPRVKKLERREFQRVIVRLEAEIRTEKKTTVISGWTRDLSVKGIYVLCQERLPVGAHCKCKIYLGDLLQGAPLIEVDGRVIRYDDTGIAVQFTNVAIECFKRLRDFFGRVDND
ncbi:MAG: PilZ domain-containing protein [Candidatus Omnitrophica bacterium]|nr:PilZ domain-containing protein [Candidatus Omnitrophota bacterium]